MDLPLSTPERHNERLEKFKLKADQDVKDALAPGRIIKKGEWDNTPKLKTLLGGKDALIIKITAGDTLSKALGDKLYGKPFAALNPNEQYFVLNLVTILSQNKVNTETVKIDDEFLFKFNQGTYEVTQVGETTKSGPLALKTAESIKSKSENERKAILKSVEKNDSIYDAFLAYRDDPTLLGRQSYLKAHQAELLPLMIEAGITLEPSKPNLGYTGTADQNKAYLKAYLKLKAISGAVPTAPAPATAPAQPAAQPVQVPIPEPVKPPEPATEPAAPAPAKLAAPPAPEPAPSPAPSPKPAAPPAPEPESATAPQPVPVPVSEPEPAPAPAPDDNPGAGEIVAELDPIQDQEEVTEVDLNPGPIVPPPVPPKEAETKSVNVVPTKPTPVQPEPPIQLSDDTAEKMQKATDAAWSGEDSAEALGIVESKGKLFYDSMNGKDYKPEELPTLRVQILALPEETPSDEKWKALCTFKLEFYENQDNLEGLSVLNIRTKEAFKTFEAIPHTESITDTELQDVPSYKIYLTGLIGRVKAKTEELYLKNNPEKTSATEAAFTAALGSKGLEIKYGDSIVAKDSMETLATYRIILMKGKLVIELTRFNESFETEAKWKAIEAEAKKINESSDFSFE